MGRADERESREARLHFWLLDDDTERLEARLDKIDASLSEIKKIAIGILVSLTTASILLVIQRL